MEEQKLTIADLLPEVMREVGYIQKQKKVEIGGGRGYKYASLEQVLEKVNEALAKRGIFVTQAQSRLDDLRETSKGIHAVTTVSILLRRGEECVGPFEGTGSGADSGDKAVMKANSAAMKYALQKAFLISWGDDPEADTSLYEEKPKAKGKPAKESAEAPVTETPKESDLMTAIRNTKTQNEHELLKSKVGALRFKDKEAYKAAVALWESEGKARGLIPAQQ